MKKNNLMVDTIANVLKGLGVRDTQTGAELSLEQIKGLNLNNPVLVRNTIRRAVNHYKLQDDQTAGIGRHEFAYHAQALKEILLSEKILPDETTCDNFLHDLRTNDVENAIDMVLCGAVMGLPEQKGMDDKTANGVAAYIENIINVGYEDFLQSPAAKNSQLDHDNFPPEAWKQYQTQQNLILTLGKYTGSHQQANQFLSQKIDAEHPILKSNERLREQYLTAQAENGNQNQDLTMLDVLMASSKITTNAQVKAFCDTRAKEQNQVQANGKSLALDDPTKLGNVLGERGVDAIQTATNTRLSSQVRPAAKSLNLAPLPDHKWRGYAKLAKRIERTVKAMYGSIQTVGFIERLTRKQEMPKTKMDDRLAWETETQPMPEVYRDQEKGITNRAGVFYNRIQAMIVSDKVAVSEYEAKLADFPTPDDMNRMNYFQNRIVAAEEVLANLQRDLEAKRVDPANQKYFDSLEQRILNLQAMNVGDQSKLMDLESSKMYARVTAKQSASNLMSNALDTFKNFSVSKDPNERSRSYAMLADLLGLRDRYNAGQLTQQNMNDLMVSVRGEVDEYNRRMELGVLDPQHLSAQAVRENLHAAAEKYLIKQLKLEKQYTNYKLVNDAAGLERKL